MCQHCCASRSRSAYRWRRTASACPRRWSDGRSSWRTRGASHSSTPSPRAARRLRRRDHGALRRTHAPTRVAAAGAHWRTDTRRHHPGVRGGYPQKARHENVPKAAASWLPLALKSIHKADGPAGRRRLSRAFRAANFAKLAALGYNRSSARGLVE
eukprot:1320247-Pleurochrysis_carterae.AAC.1